LPLGNAIVFAMAYCSISDNKQDRFEIAFNETNGVKEKKTRDRKSSPKY